MTRGISFLLVVCAGLTCSSLLFGARASAQTPPFTAYGVDQRPGVVIAASVGGRSCGPGVTVDSLGRWVLRIATDAPCAPKEGDSISFTVGGVPATPSLSWLAGGGPADAVNGIALRVSPTSGAVGFSGGSIAASGISIVSFTGTTTQLNVAGAAAQVVAVTATTGGRMLTYVIGAPAFVNSDFDAAFSSGLNRTLVIVRSGQVTTPSTAPPPPQSTPTTPATSTVGCSGSSRPVGALQAVAQVITSSGTGTSFHIGSGEWLTAAHVVGTATSVRVASATFEASASVIGVDVPRDVALLRTTSAPSASLAMIEVSVVDAGIPVWVIGYPRGVSGTASLSTGILSRVFDDEGLRTIQTDAAVNPGNSGGPLTDGCGQVVGLITSKLVASNIEGLGYALATVEVKKGMDVARLRGASTPAAPVVTRRTIALQAYVALYSLLNEVAALDEQILNEYGLANKSGSNYRAYYPSMWAKRDAGWRISERVDAYQNPAASIATCYSAQQWISLSAAYLGNYAGWVALNFRDFPYSTRSAEERESRNDHFRSITTASSALTACGQSG